MRDTVLTAGASLAQPDGGASRLLSALRSRAAGMDWAKLGVILGLALFAGAAFFLYHMLKHVTWADVKSALEHVSASSIGAAALATTASYLALVGYDVLALRQTGPHRVSLPFTALTSFISHAMTFTLGFGVLTGGAVRFRFYQFAGLEAGRVLAVGVLSGVTFWMGLATLAGLCLLIEPTAFAVVDGGGRGINMAAGLAILAALAGWITFTAIKPRHLIVADWRLNLPGPVTSLGSVLVGTADTAMAALALWLLLPTGADMSFAGFLVVFVAATVLAVTSHVPGGLGVFEAVILLVMPKLPPAEAVAALALFRVIYYVAPFTLATALLVGFEVQARPRALSAVQEAFGEVVRPMLAPITAISVFMGGFALLVSGALPAEHDRIVWLRKLVPLPFVETSHFVASIVGALLLVIAYGLVRRLKSAWRVALPLLAAGTVFSLVKGVDYEEALVCTAIIGLLWVSRPEFYRNGGLLEADLTREWMLAIVVAVGASLLIGFIVFRHVEYNNSLWWDFAYRGDAPRFLRATFGVAMVGAMLVVYRLLHHTPAMREPSTAGDIERAEAIAARSPRTEALLALIGDKRFLFSDDGEGFVMYVVQGKTWLAMGDPVARDTSGTAGLIWQFKETADLHRGTPAFYQVATDHLPAYIDAGFALAKLGEDACVHLDHFTLQGGEGRKLRQTKAAAERAGLRFEIVPREQLEPLLAALKAVSDEWLAGRKGKEKGFSLGFWSDEYMRRFDCAIVRHGDRIVAFANVWRSAKQEEFSVDLMRHVADTPNGTMDYLFISLMEAAKAECFRSFNLGMSPLSGLSRHKLASLWSRCGGLVYSHGDQFYNFEGLRAFKSKFKPEWRPRYLAYPGGLSLAQILVDATALIACSPERARKTKEAGK